jgi:hypothetical protein
MAAALSRVYAGLCRRDRLTSKECPFWLYLFCGQGLSQMTEGETLGTRLPLHRHLTRGIGWSEIFLKLPIRRLKPIAMPAEEAKQGNIIFTVIFTICQQGGSHHGLMQRDVRFSFVLRISSCSKNSRTPLPVYTACFSKFINMQLNCCHQTF